MGDDWFGHRTLEGKPIGDKDQWITWDYALIRALQIIETYTNDNGLLVYEVDDPEDRVVVHALKKINKFQAAQERITGKKDYKARPGEYFIPDLELRGDTWPTLEEYIQHQIEVENDKRAEKKMTVEDYFTTFEMDDEEPQFVK